MTTIKHEGSGQIFKNPYLEKLTRTHISIPLTIYYGAGIVLLLYTIYLKALPVWLAIVTFLVGVLAWTLYEYLFHRYVFHIDTSSEWRKNFQQKIHGIHHEYPRDKSRLAMPPLLSVVIAFIMIMFFKLIFSDQGLPFAGGFLAGYASYLLVHYSIHALKPPKNSFRYLWINHSIHHYRDQNVVFGVSSQLWDYVFGTMPKKKH